MAIETRPTSLQDGFSPKPHRLTPLEHNGFPINGHEILTPEKRESEKLARLREGAVYQIYPTTFKDSNGDGIGDLRGITESLDYLQGLGVTAIWLSPIYPSPMNDGGYDVADHKDVNPRFGTLADFDELISRAHEKGIQVYLDLVMNHTSNEHPWFQEARSARDNPYRDWYVWADPKPDGSPPNNWESFFGGSMWTYDERTGQYYLHQFHETQPDLNMRNPKVQEEMEDIIRFWLDRGVDGFRMDVLDYIFEDEDLRDAELNPNYQEGQLEIERLLWRQRIFGYKEVYKFTGKVMEVVHQYNAVGIAEIGGSDSLEHIAHLHEKGLDLPFNFQLMDVPFEPVALKKKIEEYLEALPLGATPNFVLENHDNPRLASKIGDEKTPIATMMLLTLPGIQFIYNGQEIGMLNGVVSEETNRDPQARRLGIAYSRDPARTPMQWDGSTSAGFSERSDGLWLPVADNRNGRNVAAQVEDPHSLLYLTRDLIALRKANSAFSHGDYVPYTVNTTDIFAFGREANGRHAIVVLNFSNESQTLLMPDDAQEGRMLLSTDRARQGQDVSKELALGAYEGCIIKVARP